MARLQCDTPLVELESKQSSSPSNMRVLSIVALIPGIPGFFITFFLVYRGWMWYQENPTNTYVKITPATG